MALDIASTQFLQQLADQGAQPFHALTPSNAREFFAGLREIIGDGPKMHRTGKTAVVSGDASITLRSLVPSNNPDGIIVYLHGGGWVVGSLDDYDTLARFIAAESNCAVVLVDYRLAPEHPYPAALNDAWAALRWVAENQQWVSPSCKVLPLIIAGDSAGGNLAAVLARKARLEGAPELLQQILVYPVTQPDLTTPGYTSPENQGLLGREDMAWFWNHYVPNSEQRVHPDVSPLLAEDLSGLPPAVIVTAEHDVLSAEGVAYVRRLRDASVPVSHRQFEGQIHGFFSILNALPASESARAFVVSELTCAIKTATASTT
jgi:acetyl esterase